MTLTVWKMLQETGWRILFLFRVFWVTNGTKLFPERVTVKLPVGPSGVRVRHHHPCGEERGAPQV